MIRQGSNDIITERSVNYGIVISDNDQMMQSLISGGWAVNQQQQMNRNVWSMIQWFNEPIINEGALPMDEWMSECVSNKWVNEWTDTCFSSRPSRTTLSSSTSQRIWQAQADSAHATAFRLILETIWMSSYPCCESSSSLSLYLPQGTRSYTASNGKKGSRSNETLIPLDQRRPPGTDRKHVAVALRLWWLPCSDRSRSDRPWPDRGRTQGERT